MNASQLCGFEVALQEANVYKLCRTQPWVTRKRRIENWCLNPFRALSSSTPSCESAGLWPHLKSARKRGLANSMTSRGGRVGARGLVKSTARLQCSACLLGCSTVACSGMACTRSKTQHAGGWIVWDMHMLPATAPARAEKLSLQTADKYALVEAKRTSHQPCIIRPVHVCMCAVHT